MDEVLGDINKMQLGVIQRAVEISPQITCRTLGADLEDDVDAGKALNKVNASSNRDLNNENQSPNEKRKSFSKQESPSLRSQEGAMKVSRIWVIYHHCRQELTTLCGKKQLHMFIPFTK